MLSVDQIWLTEKASRYGQDPSDPICVGCGTRPADLDCYDGYLSSQYKDLAEARTHACLSEEGTLNPLNGHFLCDQCYISFGMPSRPFPDRWVCP